MTEAERLNAIEEATRRYRRTEKAHEEARKTVIDAVLGALRAGHRPTEVVKRSPFTDAYVRRLARDNGIEAKPKGKTPASE